MPASGPPEGGTLVIAALLLLGLAFSGYWITSYADPNTVGRPWVLVRWFVGGGAAILVVAFLLYMRRGRG
jgi:hypothetical protein